MSFDALLRLSNKFTPRIEQLVEGKQKQNLIKFSLVLYCYFNVYYSSE